MILFIALQHSGMFTHSYIENTSIIRLYFKQPCLNSTDDGIWDASRVIDAQDGIRTRDLQISQEAQAPLQILPYESGALTN